MIGPHQPTPRIGQQQIGLLGCGNPRHPADALLQILRLQLAVDQRILATPRVVDEISAGVAVERSVGQLQGHIVLLGSQVTRDVGPPTSEVDAVQASVQLDAVAAALEAVAVNSLAEVEDFKMAADK